jgi:hypothetical protein
VIGYGCRARAVLARVQAADFGLQPRRSCQSIPLCYYRLRNCGGGCYARFYHHTIPEHSLDSASGYFAVPGIPGAAFGRCVLNTSPFTKFPLKKCTNANHASAL